MPSQIARLEPISKEGRKEVLNQALGETLSWCELFRSELVCSGGCGLGWAVGIQAETGPASLGDCVVVSCIVQGVKLDDLQSTSNSMIVRKMNFIMEIQEVFWNSDGY